MSAPKTPDEKLAESITRHLSTPPKHALNITSAADLAAIAMAYSGDALNTLVDLAANADSEKVQLAAANAVLDRAFGKPNQEIGLGGKDGGNLVVEVVRRVVMPEPRSSDDGETP